MVLKPLLAQHGYTAIEAAPHFYKGFHSAIVGTAPDHSAGFSY